MLVALSKELVMRKEEIQEEVETIYFGGGTPSLLSKQDLKFLLDAIYDNYKVVSTPEITLEANPDDLTKERILELAASPVNRLSIGIQSFFEEDLKMMNRAHTASDSFECLSEATRYFKNITIDLIYGVPHMTIEKWKANLQKVFDFGVSHISSYALTVEPKTALDIFIKKGKYPPLDEAIAEKHFELLIEETKKNGFVQYETSNFGKEGYFSKHNTSYWLGKSYLGYGPSAHSYKGNERSWNVSNNNQYIKSINQGILPSEKEILTSQNMFNEYLMTGLRTIWGVDLEKVEIEFGKPYRDQLENSAEIFVEKGLMKVEGLILKITNKGKFLADGIASDLFIV